MIADESKAKLRRLMEARVKRDELKESLKDAEEAFRELEAEVYEELEALRDPNDPNAKRPTVKIHLGDPWGTVSFRGRETLYGRIIDQDAALSYFNDRAMTDEVQAPKFVAKRLNEIVRDHMEQGLDMPPGVDYHPQRGVTITRQKG